MANTPNQNFQNQQLANEFQQAILKKIWSIFEYALSIGTANGANLIMDRHLDQLLLCSVYVTCRLYSFSIQFNDVIKAYRSMRPDKDHVYRVVAISHDAKHSDLIGFYNQVFIKTIKPCLNEMNATILTPNLLLTENTASQFSKKLSMTSLSTAFLSPVVPKVSANTAQQLIQFSPRKVVDNMSVFVSPIKQNNSMLGVQQNRNKLLFSLKDANPNKSMKTINEMIKRNEVKIKPNNKRLFAEISLSSSNSNSNSSSNSNLTTTTISNSNNFSMIKNITLEDEQDSSLRSSPAPTNAPASAEPNNVTYMCSNGLHRIASNVNNKIVVGSRLGYTSNSNNLVTMVINAGSSSMPSLSSHSSSSSNVFTNPTSVINSAIGVGASFARKLQNIQTERLN